MRTAIKADEELYRELTPGEIVQENDEWFNGVDITPEIIQNIGD